MKDKTKYTPGPWILITSIQNSGDHQIRAKGHGLIAHIPLDRYDDPFQILANARLVAAAPEMLEALEHTLGDAVDWDYIRSIIAKARGEK